MPTSLRANAELEREAVNATRSLFEANSWVFQEVDKGNDYGKDAYVDCTENRAILGLCVALQIKGGNKYNAKKDIKSRLMVILKFGDHQVFQLAESLMTKSQKSCIGLT